MVLLIKAMVLTTMATTSVAVLGGEGSPRTSIVVYPTNPLGYKWLRSSFNQHNPSPWASGPAPLDPSRANITFTKHHKLPNERLQHRNPVGPGPPVSLYVLTLAECFVGSGENDKTQISFIFYFFNYAYGRASPASIENCKILANNHSPRKEPR